MSKDHHKGCGACAALDDVWYSYTYSLGETRNELDIDIVFYDKELQIIAEKRWEFSCSCVGFIRDMISYKKYFVVLNTELCIVTNNDYESQKHENCHNMHVSCYLFKNGSEVYEFALTGTLFGVWNNYFFLEHDNCCYAVYEKVNGWENDVYSSIIQGPFGNGSVQFCGLTKHIIASVYNEGVLTHVHINNVKEMLRCWKSAIPVAEWPVTWRTIVVHKEQCKMDDEAWLHPKVNVIETDDGVTLVLFQFEESTKLIRSSDGVCALHEFNCEKGSYLRSGTVETNEISLEMMVVDHNNGIRIVNLIF
ncbi:hypothetical protein PCE1_004236 [Barthelona sp. PCE]